MPLDQVLTALRELLFGSPLVFTSLGFVVLFTLLFILQAGWAKHPIIRTGILTVAGLALFYQFSGWYVVLMIAVALADYALALAMGESKKDSFRTTAVLLSVTMNVGLLIYFKYTGFFYEWWQKLVTPNVPFESLTILAPVGLSYFTFKSLSYTLDVYYENIEKPERNFGYYLFYVTFFPSLLAGPITRAADFLPQIRRPYAPSRSEAGLATWLFLTGWGKKVIIADFIGDRLVNRAFENPADFTGLELLTACFAYGWMLYYDFSGYSDMARGVGLALGFEVGINFKEPFKALNISDFWRRWHLSLSTWLNDYVFIPLSFSLREAGKAGILFAVMVTFFISGFWHGAGWTFILWGLLHGTAVAYEQLTHPLRLKIRKSLPTFLYDGFSWLLTMAFLTFTFLLFRAKDLITVNNMLYRMIHRFSPEVWESFVRGYGSALTVLGLGIGIALLPTSWKRALAGGYIGLHWSLQALVAVIGWLIIYQFQSASVVPFVYLQF